MTTDPNAASPFAPLRARVDDALDAWLGQLQGADGPVPERLQEAMRYGVLGGGKRMRPVLALAACQALGADPAAALPFACALELIHAYSLVHDDLPAMDDDAMRRGKPTVHVAYGQATAILTGDALLTEAFRILADHPAPSSLMTSARLRLVGLLAEAAGAAGMVGGQEFDMRAAADAERAHVEQLHAMKTGALFRAAARGGAIAAAGDDAQIDALDRYGRLVGRAFQLTDDLLDLREAQDEGAEGASATSTGDPHEDAVNLAVQLGPEAARAEAAQLTAQARALARSFGPHGSTLDAIAALIETRNH